MVHAGKFDYAAVITVTVSTVIARVARAASAKELVVKINKQYCISGGKNKEADDVDEIKAKSEALSTATMKLGQAMYEAQQEEAAANDAAADAAKDEDEDVVDADFEEIDEDDKKSA